MTVPNPLFKLAEQLLRATLLGKIAWRQDSPCNFSFKTEAAEIRIFAIDTDDHFPFRLALHVFDSESDISVDVSGSTDFDTYEPNADTFLDLYDAARFSASKLSETVESILNEIGMPMPSEKTSSFIDEEDPF